MLTAADFPRIPRFNYISSFFKGDESVNKKRTLFVITAALIVNPVLSLDDICRICCISEVRVKKPARYLVKQKVACFYEGDNTRFVLNGDVQEFLWEEGDHFIDPQLYNEDKETLRAILSDVQRRLRTMLANQAAAAAANDAILVADDDILDNRDLPVDPVADIVEIDVENGDLDDGEGVPGGPAVPVDNGLKRKLNELCSAVDFAQNLKTHCDALYNMVPDRKKRKVADLKEELEGEATRRLEDLLYDSINEVEVRFGVKTKVLTTKCPVCLEIVNNPQVLRACGHLVCLDCTRNLMRNSPEGRLFCPTCRNETGAMTIFL